MSTADVETRLADAAVERDTDGHLLTQLALVSLIELVAMTSYGTVRRSQQTEARALTIVLLRHLVQLVTSSSPEQSLCSLHWQGVEQSSPTQEK